MLNFESEEIGEESTRQKSKVPSSLLLLVIGRTRRKKMNGGEIAARHVWKDRERSNDDWWGRVAMSMAEIIHHNDWKTI